MGPPRFAGRGGTGRAAPPPHIHTLTTMNRLEGYFGDFHDPAEPTPEDDYWVISGDCGWYSVSAETAAEVTRRLTRRWLPARWVEFTDLSGSRVRVKARQVDVVYESTAAQRRRERAFARARKLERKADRRPWEDDD